MEYGSGSRKRGWRHKFVVNLGLVLILFINSGAAKAGFQWLFGHWGECQHASCGLGGRRHREVWCMYIQTGLRVLDNYCEQAEEKPEGSTECVKPCSENIILKPDVYQGENVYESNSPEYPDYDSEWRHVPVGSRGHDNPEMRTTRWRQEYAVTSVSSDVEWVVDQWSSCRLVPGVKMCGKNSGMQYRNVSCERKDRHGRASHSRCLMEEAMPATSQSCELLCRQNCVVSSYSEWTSCDSVCQFSNQTRSRHVIVPPRHRGSHCPELSEMKVCENCTNSYMYKFSDWLPCTSFVGSYQSNVRAHYLIGYQLREITCLQSKGVLTSLRLCSERLPRTALHKHRACVMPQDCKLSVWSAMRPYNTSCIDYDGQINHGYMIRTRQVLQLALGDGQPCPGNLIDYIRLNKEDLSQLKSCKRAKWILSSWSQCQSVPGYNHCGTGIQSRRAICVEAGDDGAERPVDGIKCPQPKPLVAQSCSLECSWDCSVSQWSPWSTCQDSDCDRPNLRRRRSDEKIGKRFRTREILTLPGPGGRACSHLSETQMCQPEPCYTWNITYGPCEATLRGGCSGGTQLKKALCLNREGVKVRERFCHESLHSEQNWANCYVPCPEDCILSEWGQWSLCPDPCLVQTGVSSVKYRQRQILAYHDPGRGSRPCPSTIDLRETETCPVIYDCTIYKWEATPWGLCRLGVDNSNIHCGPGTQTRAVGCYTYKGVPAADNKCMGKVKPKAMQPCMLECPVDCHVTEWSEWSDCGVKCLPVQARQIYPTQARRRFVLQYPQNGGIPCPIDLKEEQSCFGLPVCQTYFWKVTDWSDCVLPPVVPLCGQGLKARNITCYHSDGQSTREMGAIACLEKLGSMPDMTEVCHLPCESECQFSAWSQWTVCGPRCEKTRFRFRRLMDASKNNPDCRNTELHPRDEHQDCVCDTSQPALIGGWSDCIIQPNDGEEVRFASMSLTSLSSRHRRTNESGIAGLGAQVYCGVGKRYMAYLCHNAEQVAGDTSMCTGAEYQEENCTISCPVDCQTTPWSTWSVCSSTCGAGVQQRERRIMTLPEHGGRKCPFVYGFDKETQTKVCSVDCTYHTWRLEDWGPCRPNGARSCGDGTHIRTVRCVAVGSGGFEMTVDENFCSSEDEPLTAKPCSLACPGECVMSEWSDWTLCRQPCNGKQMQSRVRHVLRMPANYALPGACATQREEKPCERWKNCIEYLWELADWTSCLVNGGSSECGVGHKERYALCRKENGEIVEPYRCEKLFGPVSEPLVVSCEVPCDNDCLLSDWSDWTVCSASCGLGFTKRRRSVLQSPMGNGRRCPDRLEQTKPCHQKGCYQWFVSEWSHCKIPNGVCGSGVQERNVSCLNDEGRPVASTLCPIDTEIFILQTTHPCHVPCSGECRMSQWSSWSECFITCEDFEQGYTVGVQARSQAVLAYPAPGNPPCHENPWEERACEAQKCSFFTWMTSEWDPTSTRHVLCVRNDGVTVTGGCDDSEAPARTLNCTNPICLSPAVCVDVDVCICPADEGFMEHLINSTTFTCITNTTALVDEVALGAETAKSANIWMYAIIAVVTLIIIAVTAALYNMCELFRTGPRPRRKEDCSPEASTAGTYHCMQVLQENEKGIMSSDGELCENIYKQINHEDQVGRNIFGETVLPLLAAPNTRCQLTSPVSCSPDTTAATSTIESASLTTTTTPLTPTNADYRSNRSVTAGKTPGVVTNSNHLNRSPGIHHKHNRRLKRIHRLLPARFASCFFCNERPSRRVVDDHVLDTDIDKVTGYQDQMLSLIETDSKLCTGDCYSNTSPHFQNHNCMLHHSHDLRPTNLDLPMHESGFDGISLDEVLKNHNNSVEGDAALQSMAVSSVIVKKGTSLSKVGDEFPTFLSPQWRTSSSESLGLSSDQASSKHAGSSHSQCSLQLGDTAETLVHSTEEPSPLTQLQLNLKRQIQLAAVKSMTTPSSLPFTAMQQRPENTASSSSNLLPKSSSYFPMESKIPNSQNLCGSAKQPYPCDAISETDNSSFSPSHAHSSPLSSCQADYLPQTRFSNGHTAHQTPRQVMDVSTPLTLSFLSDSPCCVHGSPQPPTKPHPHYRTQPIVPSVKGHIPKGRDEQLVGRNKTSPVPFMSSFSLLGTRNRDIDMFRVNSPVLEQISQDSGHSTIPRSQTASPGGQSVDNSDLIMDDRCCGLSSPSQLVNSSPDSSLCNSCGSHLTSPVAGLYLLDHSDSNSHHEASIKSMETSV